MPEWLRQKQKEFPGRYGIPILRKRAIRSTVIADGPLSYPDETILSAMRKVILQDASGISHKDMESMADTFAKLNPHFKPNELEQSEEEKAKAFDER